ncbi:hypothetical protein SMACR_03253 [Sordaria macrospora]|uniref:WGS project CABT00000000 data, contig 2.10 n=2 Tax=Sordaria macrospora TaxID=5147 RepID=F7VWC5_SORMK|nr:uncharacterized protein SMAC_03253 [Sordaria macrospora k-hell]KAA8635685.1 hypothetical protein SMACR_03253 [Sordaria macrospora]WPJ66790.1 hypothetical protein SMAC4_03253 [Sordaria macrospora]CCC09693.1 unnamed protein product [Sordaria macrospora k-hell]
MGRSYSALRASHEKKAALASKAAGANHKRRLTMALKEKGAPRAMWDPPRMSVTPLPNTPPTEKSKPKKMNQAAIQKIKDERSSELSSGRSLRSSTTSAAAKVTENVKTAVGNVKKAAKAAIQKIKDELSSESPPKSTVPLPITSSASASNEPRSGRTLRSSTASPSAPGMSNTAAIQKLKEELSADIELSADMESTAGRTEKIKGEPSVELPSAATLGPSPPTTASKSKKPRSGKTRRSSTPAAHNTATKKVKKELSDTPYHGPTLRSSATSSSGNVEPYSASTLRSSRREAVLRIQEELSAEATPNPASGSKVVATASELEREPPIEREPQPEAQPKAENWEGPEHEEAQGTMAGHRYGDHRNCPICEVWGWECPPLHISEEGQEI